MPKGMTNHSCDMTGIMLVVAVVMPARLRCKRAAMSWYDPGMELALSDNSAESSAGKALLPKCVPRLWLLKSSLLKSAIGADAMSKPERERW